MKKISVLLILMFTVITGFAQRSLVNRAENMISSGELEEALGNINLAIDPENEESDRTIDWPDTWEVRGDLYRAIYSSEDTNIKALADEPLKEALASYQKALELDENDRNNNSVKIKLTLLINDLTNQAIEGFESEDYGLALNSFEEILEIQELPLIKADNPNAIDTVIIYNAGLAAYNSDNFEKAIEYFSDAVEYGYNAAEAYSILAASYQLNEDTLGALEVLQEGFEKYPDSNNVLTSMIQIYLDLQQTDEAMEYLTVAIEREPNNATYHFARGTLYEKISEEENAIEEYSKAIELNDNYFDANYNLGALYYNRGVLQLQVASDIPASENERYQEELDKANNWFKESLPFIEKCHEIDSEHYMTLESLKNLYYRLQMMDKYNEVLEKLG